jgi:biotin carboxyl carrier protein
VPEPAQPGDRRPERSDAERSADHAAIERLSGELLPALIAKLGATGLGELEVREGAWRVRLRRPGNGPAGVAGAHAATRERRPGERDRSARSSAGAGGAHLPAGLTAVGPGRDGHPEQNGHPSRDGREGAVREVGRIAATSPAVGIFHPRPEARAGTKVRAGDRLGSVDMLGIPQEVVAPADGVVGASLVESGDAVEYGQELVLLEFASTAASEA